MKYVPPYGRESEGDSAQYVNGNPAAGIQGSIPPADAFEHPLREITSVISKSKFTPSDGDLLQLTKAVRSQRLNFVEDTGSQNAMSVACDPALTSYTVGLLLRVRVKISNTGTVTLNAGAGAYPVVHMDGTVCNPGDLPAGGIAEVCFDGSRWQLVNFMGGAGGGEGQTFQVFIPYCQDISTTANYIDAPFLPEITASELVPGYTVLVKVANTTTGPTTIKVNNNPVAQVNARGTGGQMLLTQGDIIVGDIILFHWDGTVWQMVPNMVITVNTTLNVPSQFATVPAAFAAIARKAIAQDAIVTIKLAAGIFPPFLILHPFADRIVVDGTMLVPGAVPPNLFAASGSSDAARAQDAVTNLNMLRSRFGTEIQVTADGNGIQNIGPGKPVVQNILITGNNIYGSSRNGVMVDFHYAIHCYNVATWGLRAGFCQGGTLDAYSCYASSCWSYGFLMSGPDSMTMSGCVACGNYAGGVQANQNGTFRAGQSYAFCNGFNGWFVDDNSYGVLGGGCSAWGNGSVDVVANKLSLLVSFGSSIGTSSPASDVLGNMNSYVLLR